MILRKFAVILKKYFRNIFSSKKSSSYNELDIVAEKLDVITDYIGRKIAADVCEAVDNAGVLAYVKILKNNIARMSMCTDGKQFSLIHKDALYILEKISYTDPYVQLRLSEIRSILEKPVENRKPRVNGKTVCCSVVFSPSSKEYHYLAGSRQFSVGEYVYVPVGDCMEVKTARIVKIQSLKETQSPVAISELKWVIKSAFNE